MRTSAKEDPCCAELQTLSRRVFMVFYRLISQEKNMLVASSPDARLAYGRLLRSHRVVDLPKAS